MSQAVVLGVWCSSEVGDVDGAPVGGEEVA